MVSNEIANAAFACQIIRALLCLFFTANDNLMNCDHFFARIPLCIKLLVRLFSTLAVVLQQWTSNFVTWKWQIHDNDWLLNDISKRLMWKAVSFWCLKLPNVTWSNFSFYKQKKPFITSCYLFILLKRHGCIFTISWVEVWSCKT